MSPDQWFALANLSRTANGMFYYATLKKIHKTTVKATVLFLTASGEIESPFLPVFERKRKHLKVGERALLLAPQAKIEQGSILILSHDPEQDEQNKRLDALEKRMNIVEPLAHSH